MKYKLILMSTLIAWCPFTQAELQNKIVTLVVTSTPSGALIEEPSSGKTLGRTPLNIPYLRTNLFKGDWDEDCSTELPLKATWPNGESVLTDNIELCTNVNRDEISYFTFNRPQENPDEAVLAITYTTTPPAGMIYDLTTGNFRGKAPMRIIYRRQDLAFNGECIDFTEIRMEARWKNGAAAKSFPMTGACRLGEYNVDIRRPDGFDSLETEQQLAKVRRSPETLEAGSGWKFLGEIAGALIGLAVQGYAQGYAIEQNRKTTPQHNRHGKTNIRCTSTNIGNTVSTNCR